MKWNSELPGVCRRVSTGFLLTSSSPFMSNAPLKTLRNNLHSSIHPFIILVIISSRSITGRSYLACAFPHVFHVCVCNVWVSGGQRVIELLGGVNPQKKHQCLMGQSLTEGIRKKWDQKKVLQPQDWHWTNKVSLEKPTSRPLFPQRLAYLSHVLMSSWGLMTNDRTIRILCQSSTMRWQP